MRSQGKFSTHRQGGGSVLPLIGVSLGVLLLVVVGTLFFVFGGVSDDAPGGARLIVETEPEAEGAFELNATEVRQHAPALAGAFDAALREQRAVIVDQSDLQQACDFLSDRFRDCGGVYRYGGETYRLRLIVR